MGKTRRPTIESSNTACFLVAIVHTIRGVGYDEDGRPINFGGIPVEIVWNAADGNEAGLLLFDRRREGFALSVLRASDFDWKGMDEGASPCPATH
jgi:hypothetical protein